MPTWSDTDIAIVGLSGRFPGASSPDRLWANVASGVESVRVLIGEELARAGVSAEQLADPAYVRAGAALDGVDQFDAGFFGFSPRDAAILDPQHRHFLECAWEAVEDAGHPPERFAGSIGVYAGCGMNGYFTFNLLSNPDLVRGAGLFLLRHTGNDKDFLTTGVSYLLGLTGPSIGIQTACSTSLVAVHLACQQLLARECDLALAGGVTIEIPHGVGYRYEPGEILSPDGHCRAFDAEAGGTVFGSGAGVVALRRMQDALADRDHIYAVIKGSAVNNDGRAKVGYLAPSVDGQAAAVREALAVSGVGADRIGYVEAHGTGTPIGDPIEIAALTQAFGGSTARRGYCAIGSVKTNIGHLDTAAGVAGLIKAVKALEHRQLPPSLHFTRPNPAIDFAATPFYVNTELRDWPEPESGPRCAAVNSLGVGGTNAHVILEEAPSPLPTSAGGDKLLVLSAKTPTALQRMRAELADALERKGAPGLGDAAHTLQAGRSRHRFRWSAACSTPEQAVKLLRSGVAPATDAPAQAPPVVFLFPGGGAQYPGMGRGLYQSEAVFRHAVDQCLEVLRERHGVGLAAVLFPETPSSDEAARLLARPVPSILSVFTIEYALARLLMSWGIAPAAMSGHSLGEYVAACLAGVFSVDDALAIVKARGDVFERLPAGSMLNVQAPESAVAPFVAGPLAIAAVNSPVSCVISGPQQDLAAAAERLTAAGIETQPLHIDVAAHSPMLEPFLDGFQRAVAAVRLQAPTVPFISNVTGQWITAAEATDPAYWARHLRQTVRFSDGIATLLANPGQVLLEVGPGRALSSLVRQHPARPLAVVTSLRHATEDLDDGQTALAALGRLWELGLEPDWSALHRDCPRNRVSLPTYPFERQRHWIEPGGRESQPAATLRPADGPEAPTDIGQWAHVPGWTAAPRPDAADGGPVGDVVVFADAAGVAEQVARQLRGDGGGRIVVVPPEETWLGTDDDVRSVTHVVYGRTLPGPNSSGQGLDAGLDRAFFGPLALAQTLARHELDRAVDVTFLTAGVAQIAGEGAIDPVAATLFGVSRVMPREISHVTTRVIDLLVPPQERPREQLTALLARDLRARAPQPLVAYRGQTRWVETFARETLAPATSAPFRDGGVYVITGGLGALGLEVAAHLARTRRARLVLVGRAALPPRAHWDGWLAGHPPAEPTARRIRRVRECEQLGAQVLLAVADVADVAAMQRVRQQAIEAFGVVHGIVHAAGVLDDGLMALETREGALAVLRPKVHGTVALQAAFASDDLDFLVLFSSLSAVLGLEGQADYTAANAFLDAFATSAVTTPSPVVSIGWAAWRDVGLAADAASARHGRARRPAVHPWLGAVIEGPSGQASIEVPLGDAGPWMLDEHVTSAGDRVLPGAGYLELATAALAELGEAGPVEVTELLLHQPLVVPPGSAVCAHLQVRPAAHGYELAWRVGDSVYATASARRLARPEPAHLDVEAIRARCTARTSQPRGFIDQPFMRFGSRWANVQRIDYGDGEALLELSLPATHSTDTDQLRLHPALLDMATAGAQALIPGFDPQRDFYVPFSYSHLRLHSGLPASVVSHVRLSAGTVRDTAVFDVVIADCTGAMLAEISDFCMRRLSAPTGLMAPASKHPSVHASAPAAVPLSAGAVADEMVRNGIDVTGGLEALDRILGSTHGPRVVVSPLPPEWWLARIDAARRAQEAKPTVSTTSPPHPVATFDQIESTIASMWHDLLGVAPNALDSEFFALGGQSLSAIRLANRLGRHFHTQIPIGAVFENPSLGGLSALVRNNLGAPSAAAAEGSEPVPPPLVAVPRDPFRRSLTELSVEPARKPHDQ